MKSYSQKRAQYLKKRAARFNHVAPPAAITRFRKRPTIAHRGTLTDAALRAIQAITGEQL